MTKSQTSDGLKLGDIMNRVKLPEKAIQKAEQKAEEAAIVEEPKFSRGRGRPKKPKDGYPLPRPKSSDAPKQDKKSQKTLAVLNESTRTYQVAQYLVLGYSVKDIAKQVGVTPEDVEKLIGVAIMKLNTETARILQNWMPIVFARTEMAMNRLMKLIEDEDRMIDKDTVESMLKVSKFQAQLLGIDVNQRPGDLSKQPIFQINNTIRADSVLYREATANKQAEFGNVHPELAEYVTLDDSDVRSLDGILDE